MDKQEDISVITVPARKRQEVGKNKSTDNLSHSNIKAHTQRTQSSEADVNGIKALTVMRKSF